MSNERKLSALIVDDDDDFWLILQEILLEEPLRSWVGFNRVSDGSSAIDYLLRRPPYGDEGTFPVPDFILLDQRMPLMDGTQVLEVIQADHRLRGYQVCMMSSSTEPALIHDALVKGARFCVGKPLMFEELSHVLIKIVDFYRNVALLPSHPSL